MDLGKGPKHSLASDPIDLGLSAQSAIKDGASMKLREETNEQEQRPKAKTVKVKSDRGTFDYQC